jgi:hypothetical protein
MDDGTTEDDDPVEDVSFDVLPIDRRERVRQQLGQTGSNLTIRPVKEGQDIVARQNTNETAVRDDGQGAHIVPEHAANDNAHRFGGVTGDDVRRHDLLGREPLGPSIPVMTVFRHRLVDKDSQMLAPHGRVPRTAEQVSLADHADQLFSDIYDRDTADVSLEQNMGDVFHGGGRFDHDRVRGHYVSNQHRKMQPPLGDRTRPAGPEWP